MDFPNKNLTHTLQMNIKINTAGLFKYFLLLQTYTTAFYLTFKLFIYFQTLPNKLNIIGENLAYNDE